MGLKSRVSHQENVSTHILEDILHDATIGAAFRPNEHSRAAEHVKPFEWKPTHTLTHTHTHTNRVPIWLFFSDDCVDSFTPISLPVAMEGGGRRL